MKHKKTLAAFLAVLVIGGLSCSKRETPEASVATGTTSAKVSLFGDWTVGPLLHSEKGPTDSVAVTKVGQMASNNWKFNQDGTLTAGSGTSSPIRFMYLPDNRLVLSVKNLADTFNVTSSSNNKIKLTDMKSINGVIVTENIELLRTIN